MRYRTLRNDETALSDARKVEPEKLKTVIRQPDKKGLGGDKYAVRWFWTACK